MEPLNTKERNSAFFKFMIAAMAVITLVLVIAFFDTVIPNKELDKLRNENDEMSKNLLGQKIYLTNMDSVHTWLHKLEDPGADISRLNSKISNKLEDMMAMESDSTMIGQLIQKANLALAELKLEIMDTQSGAESNEEVVKKLNGELAEKDLELKTCKADNDLLTKKIALMSGS